MLPLNWMRVTHFICRIYFMYLIARRTWCPFQQWKSKVTRWHSSMQRYVFENRRFWVQCCIKLQEVHWGPCPLTDSTGGLWVRGWQGCLNSKRAWKYMYEMYRRKILQGDHSPHVAGPQVWNNPRGLRFMIGSLMYTGGRKPSMASSKTPWA